MRLRFIDVLINIYMYSFHFSRPIVSNSLFVQFRRTRRTIQAAPRQAASQVYKRNRVLRSAYRRHTRRGPRDNRAKRKDLKLIGDAVVRGTRKIAGRRCAVALLFLPVDKTARRSAAR